jgi:cytidylate kinase
MQPYIHIYIHTVYRVRTKRITKRKKERQKEIGEEKNINCKFKDKEHVRAYLQPQAPLDAVSTCKVKSI